jgi:hypothetical protein
MRPVLQVYWGNLGFMLSETLSNRNDRNDAMV